MSPCATVRYPFAHSALFYRGDDEYLAGVVPFITRGLADSEPVAVAVPTDRLTVVRAALGVAARRVRMLDMREVGRNPGGILGGVLLAFADEYSGRRVRIVGEPVWVGRSQVEYSECVRHDALINCAFVGRAATVLCPYDADGLAADVLADAARTHPVVMDRDGSRDSDTFAPGVVAAEFNRPLPLPDNVTSLVVDVHGLARLRQVVAGFGRARGLGGRQTDALVLVLTELATNSIEHAHSPATVLLGGVGDVVCCQVRDNGHITDRLAGRRPAPPGQSRGRGLLMVNQLADLVRVHTEPGGTTVEVRFRAA
ncbi:MAG TPA: anti-sigma factor RsbA family regulatory protein [Pseudonocardiaceae bacterium]|jgi:anti-sigma regulatory factor (Ser/Thr protein kinase)|nr:anti-sigma factor RsbA family regulatory protein [Pseudonocardiaceae bacterium]